MEVPQEGKYVCRLAGQLVIYEATTGSLCAAVPCVMVDSGFTFKHTLVLVKSDGTIQTKTTDTLKAVFGWDGVDPFWLMDSSEDGGPMRDVEFEIVGGPETGDKGGIYFKSQWLNPVGGSMKTPPSADRRAVLAKYGRKFQALSASASPATAPQSEKQKAESRSAATTGGAPVPPSSRSGARSNPPPPPGAPAATMEEAWAELNAVEAGKTPGEIETLWFETIARLFPNKSNTDLKPHEWGKLKAAFADAIPM
jgi:hypothetical protein